MWRKSQIKPLMCKDTASYGVAQYGVQSSVAETRWHRVSQIRSFSLFWIPLTPLLLDPHRFVRAVHGLHKLEGVHRGGTNGVSAAQAEHPQWRALVRGTGVAIHPETGRRKPHKWVCAGRALSVPPLSSSCVWVLSVRRLRNDLWVVLPVVCQLQGQLDKSIRAYLLWLGETFPKLMKDHDFDIQIFDHSTTKERGTVPFLVAHSCNTEEWICFHKAQREQAIWIWPMQGQRAPAHVDLFEQHQRDKNFWPHWKSSPG